MRTVLVLMLAVAACGSDATMDLPDMTMCPIDCLQACGAGEVCVPGDSDHPGVCLKSCNAPGDCASPLRCEQLFARTDWVCASATVPARCSMGAFTASCGDLLPSCRDANTLMQGFDAIGNATCGFFLVACPRGCAHTVTDGGVSVSACNP